MAHVKAAVDIAAPAQAVFDAVTDWPIHGKWMLATSVATGADGGRGEGASFIARSGYGPLALVDPMTITAWDPPYRVAVRHDGNIVRGTGLFEVIALGDDRSRFVWSEELDIPLGVVGAIGFAIIKPLFVGLVVVSLGRLRRLVERS